MLDLSFPGELLYYPLFSQTSLVEWLCELSGCGFESHCYYLLCYLYAKTEINWDFQTTLYMWILESGRFDFVFVKMILRVSDDKYTRLIRQGQTENKGKMHDTM